MKKALTSQSLNENHIKILQRKINRVKNRLGTFSSISEELSTILKHEKTSIKDKLSMIKDQLEENKIQVFVARDSLKVTKILQDICREDDKLLIELCFEVLETKIYENIHTDTLLFTDPVAQKAFEEKRLHPRELALSPIDRNRTEHIKKLRDFSYEATLGIGTVDFASSEYGSLVIIDWDSTRTILCTAPRRNVFVIGLEKIVTSFLNAVHLAYLRTKSFDKLLRGQIHIVNNPSRTGDIEKVVVYGAHGPREVTTILVDNGRLSLLEKEEDLTKSSIISQFIETLYPELSLLAMTLNIPSLDPLKIMLLANNDLVDPIDAGVLINTILRYEPLWGNELLEVLRRSYKVVLRNIREGIKEKPETLESETEQLLSILNTLRR